jgi:hypothetical protein
MKTQYLLILTAVLSVLTACEDFMEIHEKYIEDGEIIYAPKVDTVAFLAGRERLMFRFRLYNSPNVRSVNLYWNDDRDSLIVPVTPTTGLDSTEVLLTGMPEKSYTFHVKTVDKYDHTSLITTDFGTSYGATFQGSLLHRRIREVTLTGEDGKISWYAAAENLVGNEIRYETPAGEKAVVWMPATEEAVVCPGARAGSTFEYRSLFIPEEAAIDTFAVDWTVCETPFPGR